MKHKADSEEISKPETGDKQELKREAIVPMLRHKMEIVIIDSIDSRMVKGGCG